MANEDTLQQLRDSQGNWSTIETGQDTVATAGTAVQLNGGTSLAVPDGASVAVIAADGNTGSVYVGDSSVTTSNGAELTPDSSLSLNVADVSTIHIDADNSGDGVSWIAEVEA